MAGLKQIKACMDKLERAVEQRERIKLLLWAVRDVNQSLPTVAEYKRLAAETDTEIAALRRDLDRALN